MRSRRLKRWALWTASSSCALPVAGWLLLVAYTHTLPLPVQLQQSNASTVVIDRGGQLLAQVRVDGQLSVPVSASDLSPYVVDSLLAAEDKRFFEHGGIDPWAMVRAFGQMLRHGRVVSGASTLTQQLARSTFRRERSLLGKLREIAVALRIEQGMSKEQILVAYLNRIEFGPNLVGIGAASNAYFAKPVGGLSLSEAATLVAIPRGPTLYDPKRTHSPVQKRRDRILRRLAASQPQLAAAVHQALRMPVELQTQLAWPGAFHWVRRLAGSERQTDGKVRTTLDAVLQRRVEALVLAHSRTIEQFGATAAAVLVADNQTHEVLAYVGSPDYFSMRAGGQNDGIAALRQPGSTLKPFVYATAMQQLGYTAATLLPDIPLELREHGQVYAPRNYDGRFRGPVRLREALANSLNVPAVHTAAKLGPARVLSGLHAFGFDSLTRDPEHYGVALALGDGEVRLEELVAAYMSLANQGRYAPLRLTQDARAAVGRQVTSETVAAILTDILQDPHARASAFGRNNALEFAYPVAAKTGTSKGARDNWTLGFSSRVTVGVWVGNFDGTPMVGASGVSGAGPLFAAVMNEGHTWQGRRGEPERAPSPAQAGAVSVEVCALSGLLPTDLCPTRLREWFVPGTQPTLADSMHVEAAVLNGALAPNCAGAERRVFETYPPQYAAWASEAGRPTLPDVALLQCSGQGGRASRAPALTFPRSGAVYRRVADEPAARQQLVLRAQAAGVERLTYVINGRPYQTVRAPFDAPWPLTAGEFDVYVVTDRGQRSESVRFSVE